MVIAAVHTPVPFPFELGRIERISLSTKMVAPTWTGFRNVQPSMEISAMAASSSQRTPVPRPKPTQLVVVEETHARRAVAASDS